MEGDITKRKISASLKGRTDIVRGDWTGKRHSEESKKKISNALKGRTDIIRGLRQDWTGKHHSEESKHKMSNSHNDLNNNFIKTFDSITNAAKETNNNRESIGKCCNNKNKTAGGFIWRFGND